MGFSVSGATVVVSIGLLVSAATLYPALDRYGERRVEAVDGDHERALDRQNTALGAANATHDPDTERLVVTVENTGTTALDVGRVDLLVDGRYRATPAANVTVAGDADTATWLPGERLRVVVDQPAAPARVKVVTGPGVAVAVEVA
jgi:flagellar protein FlaF